VGRKFEVIQPGNTASPPSSMRMPMRRKASRWQPGATPKTKDVVQAPPITPPPIVTCPGHPASPCPASTGKGPHTALPRPTRYAPYYSVRPTIMLIHRHQGRLFLDRKGGKLPLKVDEYMPGPGAYLKTEYISTGVSISLGKSRKH
jgi:hypothetical protein